MKRRGDKWFTDVYKQVVEAWEAPACHVYSNVKDCKAFQQWQPELQKSFRRALLESDYEVGFPNYANNDNCVANSITASYWEGEEPDYAVHSTVSSFLVIVLILINQF